MFITTLNSHLFKEYGHLTVSSWGEMTKEQIAVVVSPEELDVFKGLLSSRYRMIPFGAQSLHSMAAIRERETQLDYMRHDFRWQASRFSWKIFAIHEALNAFPEENSVTWLDADSLIRPGIDKWLKALFSETHAVSFLGREHKSIHAETGLINFVGSTGRQLFQQVFEIYRTLRVFDFKEWHDAYIFTSVFLYNKYCYDISKHRGVRSSNPLYEIDRGKHLLHLKGNRKSSSRFLIDDLRVILGR